MKAKGIDGSPLTLKCLLQQREEQFEEEKSKLRLKLIGEKKKF